MTYIQDTLSLQIKITLFFCLKHVYVMIKNLFSACLIKVNFIQSMKKNHKRCKTDTFYAF